MDENLQQQYETIYNEYYKKVYHLIWSKINNSTEAEDITSDIFVKIYSKIDTFDETKASLSTWIYRIANNYLIDYYRTRKVFSEVPEDITEDGDVDENLLNNETLEMLANALEQLPERDRDLIILHYYKGMTLKDAAQTIGMSYSNAKLVHNKSLVTLQNLLGELI